MVEMKKIEQSACRLKKAYEENRVIGLTDSRKTVLKATATREAREKLDLEAQRIILKAFDRWFTITMTAINGI